MSGALCESNKEIPAHMLLGDLLFYSLSDMKIPEQELMNIFTNNNIPTSYIRKISPADAYRRATSSLKKTIDISDANGFTIKAKIEIDEIKSDGNGIVRLIGRKIIDENNEAVDYESIAYINYVRKSNTVNYNLLEPTGINASVYLALCEEADDKFQEWSVYHNKDTVRNIINRIIQDTHPVALTPTGLCKFVPKSHSDLLYYLKDAIAELKDFGIVVTQGKNVGSTQAVNFMEIIPVIDTEEQRELIKGATETELKASMFAFTQELKDVLVKRNTLPPRTVAAYLDRFKEMREKVEDYESLLGNYLGFLKVQLTEAVTLVKDSSEESQEEDNSPVYV